MAKPLKNKTVYVRMTVKEYKALELLAKRMRTDKSGAIRAVLATGGHLLAKAINEGTVEVVESGS
jgi:hypothetical protein